MGKLAEMAKGNNGYISSSQATVAGIPRRLLGTEVAAGNLVQVARGLYALPDTWEDPLFVLQHRFARGGVLGRDGAPPARHDGSCAIRAHHDVSKIV